jgi:PAS domain S-box-containing protein
LETKTEEFTRKEEDFAHIQKTLEGTATELKQITQQCDETTNENAQLQIKLLKRMEEFTKTTEELQQVQQRFKNKCDEFNQLQSELGKLQKERDLKDVKLMEQTRALGEIKEELKATKSALNWFKMEVDDKQDQLQLRKKEIETRTLEIEDLKKQVTEHQNTLGEKHQMIEQLQAELERTQQHLGIRTTDLAKREEDLQEAQKKLEERDKEIEFRTSELRNRKDQIQQLQTELQLKQQERDARHQELLLLQVDREQKMHEINTIKTEKDHLNFLFQKMKNAIPSSVIMVDKDNRITDWNKKAQELLGFETEHAVGSDLFTLDVMEKERLREGIQHCRGEKKPVIVKSVSLKNQQGTRFLTDISQIPLLDSTGALQGMLMVIDDISDVAEVQARCERQQEDMKTLEGRFQETFRNLKAADMEKNAMNTELMKLRSELELGTKTKGTIDTMIGDKQKELDAMNQSISSKMNELNIVTIKLEGIKSVLEMLETERQKKNLERPPAIPSDAWKERLKIYDEIDKSLNVADDGLKTKKLKDEESK